MNKDKNQDTLSERQLIIDALREDNQDNPDFLRKVEEWERIEKNRKKNLRRFLPPIIYSDAMMGAMFDTWFREDIHKFIAKHAGSQIDDYFLRYVVELPMTLEEFLKLHKLLEHQGSEDDIQNALMKLLECWTTKEPYLTLLEKVVAGEFAKILPTVVERKRVDEYRKMKRFVSLEAVEGVEPQTEPSLEFIDRESLLAKLEEEERQIIELLYEGYTQEEIGKKFGRGQPWVSKKLSKIKKKLYFLE
ncbi:MAG: sigma factor-like helix-turn-helix DNA-binding protein [bacterium]